MDDLISRQAVIEINRSYHGQMPNEVNHRIWEEINELPSVQPEVLACGEGELIAQPEREKWHWIDKTDPDWDGEWDDWQCSCCGSLITSMAIKLNGLYLYCPKCGARMENNNESD